MLTAESEGGQLKCHPYWTGRDYGVIKLRLLSEKKVSLDLDKHRSNSTAHMGSASMTPSTASSESGRRRANTTTTIEGSTPTPQPLQGQSETPYVIIRKFALSHAAQPFAPIREVTHLHYPSWPDFGAPAQPSHLLALVELANVMQRAALPIDTPSIAASRPAPQALPVTWYDEPEVDARVRPMLVHCSAGCGRTGTFCTVDSVIDMLKRQRLVSSTASLHLKKHDAEGDVEMDEAVSPRTAVNPPQFPFSNPSGWRPGGDGRCGSGGAVPFLDTAWMDDDDAVDLIDKTVQDFREQRLSMVQSLRQFVLCYETVIEWIWRMQDRNGAGLAATPTSRGRARSGSLQIRPEISRLADGE
jgi:tyrosine-protein phosphatase 2/3